MSARWPVWDEKTEQAAGSRIDRSNAAGRVDPASPLAEIVEDAYRLFRAPAPMIDVTCPCPACISPEAAEILARDDVRTVPLWVVSEWFHTAVEPGLPIEYWTWLLPRVLEGLASGDPSFPPNYELALSRFPIGDATRWTTEQWLVLERFRTGYLDQFMPGGLRCLDDVLCLFALGHWPLDDLIDQVIGWPAERLLPVLADDWSLHEPSTPGSFPLSPFWSDPAEPWRCWLDGRLEERFDAIVATSEADSEMHRTINGLRATIERERRSGPPTDMP